jgi:hypothetical protein
MLLCFNLSFIFSCQFEGPTFAAYEIIGSISNYFFVTAIFLSGAQPLALLIFYRTLGKVTGITDKDIQSLRERELYIKYLIIGILIFCLIYELCLAFMNTESSSLAMKIVTYFMYAL